MRTYVYIDGFNLYYGAVRRTPYKWLNLLTLCQLLLPGYQIARIKYFTAHVQSLPNDPGQSTRQQTYLRALRTLPNLDIILGHFLTTEVSMRLVQPPAMGSAFVRVIKTEEKGSDVNLAAHLLHDGHLRRYEVAVLLTNDSDLLEPVKMVRYELGLPVGIINPHPRPSQVLVQHASFRRQIRQGVLAASQFPPTLIDAIGTFHKPSQW